MPPWLQPRAAYVHVPFCAHHCGYCDFAVVAGRDALIDRYLDALAAEVATLGQPCQVETLFLGGGTPTHLTPGQLGRLLTMLTRWLPLAPGGEFSVEANPDTLTEEKVAVLAGYGVNRVSLGAQSFHAGTLAVLERSHDPAAIAPAVGRVKAAGLVVSLDLIFGVPGQALDGWRADLDAALVLGPDHVSTYGLTYEKGTPLWKQRRAGRLVQLDEDAELAMYRLAIDTLESAGLVRYEVSNFAQPGRRCRHNQVYWANHAYHGFGLGAARYVQGTREVNTRDLDGYIRKALAGQPVARHSERLGPEERARETMAVQLRRAEGIDRAGFEAQTGFPLDAVAGERLLRLVEQGLLGDDGARVALTRRGLVVADAVVERLL
ncbi:MAG: radical SAM family heme chaperone HemW [Gemmataceae bacterium]